MKRMALLIALFVGAGALASEPLRFDFSPSPMERVLAKAASVEGKLDCPRCAQPPVVDGKLDDAAWRSAAIIDGLVLNSGAPAAPKTRVRLCFDGRARPFGVAGL